MSQSLLNPTPARVRAVAVAAFASALVWIVVFTSAVAPLWGPSAPLFAGSHLIGVAVLTYTGLLTWTRQPSSRIGPLLIAAAFANHVAALQWYPIVPQFSWSWTVIDVANWLGGLPNVILVQAALTFPTGRFTGTFERVIVTAAYVIVVAFGWLLPTPLYRIVTWPGIVVMVAAVVALVVRYRSATHVARRVIGPVPFVVLAITIASLTYGAMTGLETHTTEAMRTAQFALVITNPLIGLAFSASLLRTRLAGAGVGDLVIELQRRPGAEGLAAALRTALRDPGLDVGYWLSERGVYVDAHGDQIGEDDVDRGRIVTPIRDATGDPLAVLVHDAALADDPPLLDAVGAAAHFALENARLHAELAMRLREVQASRVRLVAAADAERRRVERDLHDGAQQQLVLLAIMLEEARQQAQGDGTLSQALEAAAAQLQASLRELRELARGIHPMILTRSGLGEALSHLAKRAPIDVTVTATSERFGEAVESTLYFVAAEAITNVAKHAGASSATVELTTTAGTAVLQITDDGVGGARSVEGGGLQGLADRVAALGGTLHIDSNSSDGTSVSARVPAHAVPRT